MLLFKLINVTFKKVYLLDILLPLHPSRSPLKGEMAEDEAFFHWRVGEGFQGLCKESIDAKF